MAAKKKPDVEPEEPSRTGGACVLIALAGAVVGVVFAVSATAGLLFVWAAGVLLLWRSVRRTANPAPPPGPGRPSCRRCAGQDVASVTPQKGMWIYTFDLPDRPNHAHIHLSDIAPAGQ